MKASSYALTMSEDQLTANIRDLALNLNYMRYHTHDSRRSPAGFPDEVLLHRHTGALFIVELKNATRPATPDQLDWLKTLAKAQAPHSDLWRPEHWQSGQIQALLKGGAHAADF